MVTWTAGDSSMNPPKILPAGRSLRTICDQGQRESIYEVSYTFIDKRCFYWLIATLYSDVTRFAAPVKGSVPVCIACTNYDQEDVSLIMDCPCSSQESTNLRAGHALLIYQIFCHDSSIVREEADDILMRHVSRTEKVVQVHVEILNVTICRDK